MHVEGYYVEIQSAMMSPNGAHVEGYYTTGKGHYGSHTEGAYNYVISSNESEKLAMHVVGIGDGNSSRKNAHVILKNGEHYIYGIGGYGGTDTEGALSLQQQLLMATKPSYVKATHNTQYEPDKQDIAGYVAHPMENYPGAQFVLMRYNKRNGKKHQTDPPNNVVYHNYKKGWGVAIKGVMPGTSEAIMSPIILNKYSDGGIDPYSLILTMQQRNFPLDTYYGVALRIPNPDYDGPITAHGNALYQGQREYIYSDILLIHITHDGIGLRR